jgi:periplasmic divalent cation tolerance protein
MAETTTATLCPWRWVASTRWATAWMRSTVPTEVPPNFCTMSTLSGRLCTIGARRSSTGFTYYNRRLDDSFPGDFVVVFVTMPDADTAARLGRTVVEERLAACVNVIPGLRSIYEYGGKLCDDAEVLCLFKTRRALYPALRDRLTACTPTRCRSSLPCRSRKGMSPIWPWLAAGTAPPAR